MQMLARQRLLHVFYTSNEPEQAAQELSALARRVRFSANSVLAWCHVAEIPADAKAYLEQSVADPGTPEQKKLKKCSPEFLSRPCD